MPISIDFTVGENSDDHLLLIVVLVSHNKNQDDGLILHDVIVSTRFHHMRSLSTTTNTVSRYPSASHRRPPQPSPPQHHPRRVWASCINLISNNMELHGLSSGELTFIVYEDIVFSLTCKLMPARCNLLRFSFKQLFPVQEIFEVMCNRRSNLHVHDVMFIIMKHISRACRKNPCQRNRFQRTTEEDYSWHNCVANMQGWMSWLLLMMQPQLERVLLLTGQRVW